MPNLPSMRGPRYLRSLEVGRALTLFDPENVNADVWPDESTLLVVARAGVITYCCDLMGTPREFLDYTHVWSLPLETFVQLEDHREQKRLIQNRKILSPCSFSDLFEK